MAGAVATSGETLNIADAYGHPLFDPATDRRTGYRTRNILCAPIRDSRGEVVAVTEVLNKQGGDAFDTEDERELADFAAAMSVIVDSWRTMSRRQHP